jgi:hypothetical protein
MLGAHPIPHSLCKRMRRWRPLAQFWKNAILRRVTRQHEVLVNCPSFPHCALSAHDS